MSIAKPHEHLCLHMDPAGVIWRMTPQGVARPVIGQELEPMLRSDTYRIVGLPDNYRLITELYSLLVGRKSRAKIWIGSPEVCQDRDCAPEVLLTCLSVMEVHDNLHGRWHVLSPETYNHFLLLRALHDEGFSDLTLQIYNSHCVKPFCQFLGLHEPPRVIALLAQIGDPRWYLNPRRPYRLARLESYFGLVPAQFKDARDSPRKRRTRVLLELIESLPQTSCLFTELIARPNASEFKICRLLLGFLVRNWLTRLTPEDHFDPQLFFRHAATRADFVRQFKD
jgi:hypothetical protein